MRRTWTYACAGLALAGCAWLRPGDNPPPQRPGDKPPLVLSTNPELDGGNLSNWLHGGPTGDWTSH
jgi:hypothetical protein